MGDNDAWWPWWTLRDERRKASIVSKRHIGVTWLQVAGVRERRSDAGGWEIVLVEGREAVGDHHILPINPFLYVEGCDVRSEHNNISHGCACG
ncbi:hypothetical protein GW17_00052858 [Ensete ventricosum]|nr:hypothetical protein GW17_00052858 [Ensete ventricosum]